MNANLGMVLDASANAPGAAPHSLHKALTLMAHAFRVAKAHRASRGLAASQAASALNPRVLPLETCREVAS